MSGSSSECYLQNDGKYLNHSSSGISLSTSKVSWKFSSGRFSFQQSISSRSKTTYYLVYKSGFTVSTSSSYSAAAYTVKAGTAATEGEKYSVVTIDAVSRGNTTFEIGNVIYIVTVKKAPITVVLNVNVIDDAGKTLKDSYTISGLEGEEYAVTPQDIAGYIKPETVSGIYSSESKDITLVYTLNSDKTALKAAIDGKVSKGNYTDESYSAYSAKIDAGQAVYDYARALQSEIDAALKAINDAKAALVEKSTGFPIDSNGVDSGSSYIIVNGGYALSGVSAVKVSLNGTTVADPADKNAVWKITKTTLGYTVYNEGSGKYLGYKTGGSGSKRTCTPVLSSTKKYWKVIQSGTGIRLYVNSTYNFYLACSKGSFTMTRTATAVDIYKVK